MLVAGLVFLAVATLGGCAPETADKSAARWLVTCGETCAPATVERASVRGGWECACRAAEGACSVDRLLVTPVPVPAGAQARKGGAKP